MNYFEFYELTPAFELDTESLRKAYLKKSKELHPDFNQSSGEENLEVMQQAALNNLAYNTLKDRNKRIKYLLELCGFGFEEGKEQVPQEFLFQMMELNEELMQLEFESSPNSIEEVKNKILLNKKHLDEELAININQIDNINLLSKKIENHVYLLRIKEYLLKNRYLDRLLENLKKLKPRL